ncbi:hypothetical protein PHLCEN_2v1842 [Hermanssonia centrifuga]|uniref:Roadblock/LAMTOR2 domain-containing protein n=1 Tax=Hermanssonia centrifuga TaxID=98765 RepID=A0A2R6RVS9_9APHY|nr:hypothetical protein PHLCEN_2v1842 [Hermanssonia centrifuga]
MSLAATNASGSLSPLGVLGAVPSVTMSPELEQTLASLTSHRSVLGYMLVSRGRPATIIRHSGVIFEGEQGRKYANAVTRIVESVRTGLEEVAGDSNEMVRVIGVPLQFAYP